MKIPFKKKSIFQRAMAHKNEVEFINNAIGTLVGIGSLVALHYQIKSAKIEATLAEDELKARQAEQ